MYAAVDEAQTVPDKGATTTDRRAASSDLPDVDDLAGFEDMAELEDGPDLGLGDDEEIGDDADLDDTGLDGTDLDDTGLDGTDLDDTGLDDTGLDDTDLDDTGLDDTGLDSDGLDVGALPGSEPVVLAGTVSDLVALNPAEAVVAPAEADTDDDVLITDEVEASLDVILAERMRARDVEVDEEPEDDEDADGAPNQLATVIPVRRPDEFLCQSCFLLKPPGQLADRAHQLCRDCA